MSNNLHLLPTLKEKLITSDNFSEIMHYFFDHFAENDEFMSLGRIQFSKAVETMAIEAASSAFGERVILRGLRLVRLPQQKFCHGPCFVNGCIANIFFFEDINTGMMGIAMPGSDSEMRYIRITAVPMPEKKSAKWN